MNKEANNILEKLQQLKKLDKATFSDTFSQRMNEVYAKEGVSAEVVIGVELVLIWKSFDELLKQLDGILGALKGTKKGAKNA